MARVKSDEYEYRDGKRVWISPKYPVALGADVQDWRRVARLEKLSRELLAAWPRMPSLKRPPIYRSPSPLNVPYSRPNPFRMVGDPEDRNGELRLYAHALGLPFDEAHKRVEAQEATLAASPK